MEVEERVRVPEREPVEEGMNWRPSQQLKQVPETVEMKAPVAGWPWP